jgi:hypothetical protein
MLIQLNPPLTFDTPKGPAYAHFLLDYGTELPLYWVCFIRETGECWVYPQAEILLEKNITLGVRSGSIKPSSPRVGNSKTDAPSLNGIHSRECENI